jgi:hypothetical protein
MAEAGIAQQRAGTSQIVSLPGPVGGWNTRDAVDTMPPEDAIQLDNLFPSVGKVELRGGYEDYVSSSIGSDNVETLATLVVGATEYFLCGTNNKLYEITNGGAPADRTGAAVITVDRWQWTVFADSSAPTAPTLLLVNGTDQPLKWTGSGNVASWSPTGPTVANLIGVHSFKNRVYAWEKNSRDFWYGDVGAIPGTMTRFPLSGIRGAQGNLLAMATWTRDGGAGPDDFAVFITDAGSVIVYEGYWPGGGEATWRIAGVYQIPRPLGVRAWANVLGDLLIATESDYVFLSEALQKAGVTTEASKLAGALAADAASYRSNFGWQVVVYPRGNKIICNVPLETDAQYQQHVINVQTRAACRFTGWNFRCFGVFAGNLYAGGSGKVYRCDIGRVDDATGTPTAIQVRAKTAFVDFGLPGRQKRVTAVRPLLKVSETLTATYSLAVDFQDKDGAVVSSEGSASSSPAWDDPLWDVAYWSTEATARTQRAWRMLGGRGSDFSVGLVTDVKNQALEWLSTDYLIEPSARI